jgi:hypothetical protein
LQQKQQRKQQELLNMLGLIFSFYIGFFLSPTLSKGEREATGLIIIYLYGLIVV